MSAQAACHISKYALAQGWAIRSTRRNQAAVTTQFTASVSNLPHRYMTPDCLLQICKFHIPSSVSRASGRVHIRRSAPGTLQQITTKTFSYSTRQPLCVSGQQRFCTRPSARIMAHQKAHISIRTERYGHVNGQRKSDHRRSSGSHVMTSQENTEKSLRKAHSVIGPVRFAKLQRRHERSMMRS